MLSNKKKPKVIKGSQEEVKELVASTSRKRKSVSPDKKSSKKVKTNGEEGVEVKFSQKENKKQLTESTSSLVLKSETKKNKRLTEASSKKRVSKKARIDEDSKKDNVVKKEKTEKNFGENKIKTLWKDEDYLAETENLSLPVANNIIKLFKEENTIPFIARYRSDLTGDLKPDKLRKIKATYNYIQQVHKKAVQVVSLISSQQKLNSETLVCIQKAHSLEELEFISAPYKKEGKRTFSERARKLGLEAPALTLLEGKGVINPKLLVSQNTAGLEDVKKVNLGLQHIIADVLSKSSDVPNYLDKILSSRRLTLQSKFRSKEDEKNDLFKYSTYGDFSQPVQLLKPYQVLAINRGEEEKKLSVKINVPDDVWYPLKTFFSNKWLKNGQNYDLRTTIFYDSVEDAIKRMLTPLVIRRVRAKLNKDAEEEAINVFAANLRQLLLTPPCPGKVVMGIDPGFKNGCKVAVVSPNGSILGYNKIFFNEKKTASLVLYDLMRTHSCSLIALGNGAGCREAETLLSDLIQKGTFKPLDVSYTIVSEQGVSIYSCSNIASEEFPTLDTTIISAVSLARRLQNPLSELVKIEPKHLGVGMYQHDVNEKKLVSVLDEIVSECVSFVGVDINSASLHLLKRVAGLGESKAKQIIKHRSENCSFRVREDLKKVKGIKTKTFLQCAGFIRILPVTAGCQRHVHHNEELNSLDQTSIHPESYEIAKRVVDKFGLKVKDLGQANFIRTVEKNAKNISIKELAENMGCSLSSMQLIIENLQQPTNFDLRSLYSGPIFRQSIKNLNDVSLGQTLKGVVRNIVSFGAFVDVGIGKDALIHISKMGNKILKINDKVEVQVTGVELAKQRVQLKLLSVA